MDSFEPKHDAYLLQAVNTVATNLIMTDPSNFAAEILKSLMIIGMALNADRTYIWENFEENGKLFCRQIYEWSESVEAQQGKDFTIQSNYDYMPLWRECITCNKTINGPVKYIIGDERLVLEGQGIKSILMIPLYLEGRPWGFIGFDDCHTERTFSKEKEQVLQSAGILVISSIIRNRTTQKLMDTKDKLLVHERLLRAVNRIARLLLEADHEDFISAIRQALMTLGVCVNADRVSVWRNHKDEQGRPASTRLAGWLTDQSLESGVAGVTIDYDSFIPGWNYTRKDLSGHVSELNEKSRKLLLLDGYNSLLLIPVNIHGDFWGFISFIYKLEERSFSEAEKNILRSGGMLIASAIVRNEITESLMEARENALASSRSKSEFLSRMSHEIRTPMNAIIGMTSLAQKSDDITKIRYYLDKVDSSSRQLLSIINDVLDMSKIDANKMDIVNMEFDFKGLLGHVTDVIQVKMDEKKLDFRLDYPQPFSRCVISDELRISQVLLNLLSNSVKFTPERGSVTLKIRESPIDADHSTIRLEVIDTGIGISPEALSHIFQPFEQADGGTTRQYGGTGLGLAICERIISFMGGRIWAESELGKGSSFIVELGIEWGKETCDRTEQASEDGVPADGETCEWNGRCILLAEDIDINRELISGILEGTGVIIDNAVNGREAVDMYISAPDRYELILMDIQMPVMDGLNAARQIRASGLPGCATIPIIAMTANAFKEDAKASIDAGMNDHINKPIDAAEIYAVLKKALG